VIVRMAKENPGSGYVRIRGELLMRGHRVATTTIRSVLIRARVPPAGSAAASAGSSSWQHMLRA